jgi:hypothetical protein
MAEVALNRAGIHAVVCQLVAARMAQHGMRPSRLQKLRQKMNSPGRADRGCRAAPTRTDFYGFALGKFLSPLRGPGGSPIRWLGLWPACLEARAAMADTQVQTPAMSVYNSRPVSGLLPFQEKQRTLNKWGSFLLPLRC